MRHVALGVQLWGAFLLLIGVGLVVFNKRWAEWTAPLVPFPFTGRVVLGRFMTVIVGLMFLLVGASLFLPMGPG